MEELVWLIQARCMYRLSMATCTSCTHVHVCMWDLEFPVIISQCILNVINSTGFFHSLNVVAVNEYKLHPITHALFVCFI